MHNFYILYKRIACMGSPSSNGKHYKHCYKCRNVKCGYDGTILAIIVDEYYNLDCVNGSKRAYGNIAFSAPLRHDSAHFWRLKVHADTRLSRRPAGRREETTVYKDRKHGIQGLKTRYTRIETTVWADEETPIGQLPDRRFPSRRKAGIGMPKDLIVTKQGNRRHRRSTTPRNNKRTEGFRGFPGKKKAAAFPTPARGNSRGRWAMDKVNAATARSTEELHSLCLVTGRNSGELTRAEGKYDIIAA